MNTFARVVGLLIAAIVVVVYATWSGSVAIAYAWNNLVSPVFGLRSINLLEALVGGLFINIFTATSAKYDEDGWEGRLTWFILRPWVYILFFWLIKILLIN